MFVADTYNHIIRRVTPGGHTYTLAGNLEIAEKIALQGFDERISG